MQWYYLNYILLLIFWNHAYPRPSSFAANIDFTWIVACGLYWNWITCLWRPIIAFYWEVIKISSTILRWLSKGVFDLHSAIEALNACWRTTVVVYFQFLYMILTHKMINKCIIKLIVQKKYFNQIKTKELSKAY